MIPIGGRQSSRTILGERLKEIPVKTQCFTGWLWILLISVSSIQAYGDEHDRSIRAEPRTALESDDPELPAAFAFVHGEESQAKDEPPPPPRRPREGERPGEPMPEGPPRFELGRLFPPPVRQELNLTSAQLRALEEVEKEVKEKLNKVLTEDQKKIAENFRPRGPGGPGGRPPAEGNRSGRPEPSQAVLPSESDADEKPGPRFVIHAPLKAIPANGQSDVPYQLSGDAREGALGDLGKEYSGRGVRFLSGEDADKDGRRAGRVSWLVGGVNADHGRWFRLHIRALAQEDFRVGQDELFLQVDFFKDGGKNNLDHVKKLIYPQVEAERRKLADAGTNRNLGPSTWRDYALEFRTPFKEVDQMRLTAGFENGAGSGPRSEFWIGDVEVTPIADPADYKSPAPATTAQQPPALKALIKLGGRWYYQPRQGETAAPQEFDHLNVDRLYYFAGRLETPFAGNTTAWLRKGYLDRSGKLVDKDQFVADNVILSFTDQHLVMKSKNLPNHPTAVFPDRWRLIDGNPNYISERRNTWYIPLEPKENPQHLSMDERNKNKALPMGPIGVAVNGVVFFNPFDHIAEADAVWRLDRCCGHPSPGQEYHYHKYPVCINTPWSDDGEAHSPLIGFAFDGFPVYGPYESSGELAKDSTQNPLNAFNLHRDDQRGWHYHVTPGKFPHILGGYWGEVESKNRGRRGPAPERP